MAKSNDAKKRRGLTIRGKLIGAVAGVAAATLALTVGPSTWVTSNRLQTQTGDSMQEVAARTADLLSQTLIENVHLIEALASVGPVVEAVERANAGWQRVDPATGEAVEVDVVAELEAREVEWQGIFTYSPEVIQVISDDRDENPVGFELHRFAARFPRHVEILVTDHHGALLAATNRTQNFYFGQQGWWQTTAGGDGQVFLSAPAEDPDTGVISVVLGVPIHDASGAVIGTLCSALDVREIRDILGQVELGATGIVRVYDSAGTAIFDPENPRLGRDKLPAGLAAANVVAAARPGWTRADSAAGNDAIHGFAKPVRTASIAALDEIGWTTVASQDTSEALAAVRQVTTIQVAVAFFVAILAVVTAVLVSALLTRPIDHITRLFDEIHRGNYEARAQVVSRDELGAMTTELNAMLDNTLTLIQSQEQRDAIQASVMRLLDEVADVAQGDLTVRAEVTTDITGAIADSFNYMIAELRRIIGNVQETSAQVTAAAGGIRSRMELLADGSTSQSQQIQETSERIRTMAGSIQEVSQNAVECSTVARDSLQNARHGNDAVDKTVAGMNAIRGQVREASKRLKRLGESSQEIGEIVRLIREVSDRTSILALNASIQAAAAGEAGESFAVVADEIESLAERSTEASHRIETLIKTVQVETAEAVAAMEDTTREVVEGSQLAHTAGHALAEIESVSRRLAELVESITEAAGEQAQSSEALAQAMSEISQITQQTAFGTRQATTAAEELAGQADSLRDSVRRFTVPAKVA